MEHDSDSVADEVQSNLENLDSSDSTYRARSRGRTERSSKSPAPSNPETPPSESESYGNSWEEGEEEEEVTEEEVISEFRVGPRDSPTELPPSFLISVDYAGRENKAIARLYRPDTKEVFFWFDNTGHKPYCYTDLPPEVAETRARKNPGFVSAETSTLRDLLRDRDVVMTKVVGDNPLAIGGAVGAIRELLTDRVQTGDPSNPFQTVSRAWEANIRYRNCYTYDAALVLGMMYRIEKGNLVSCPAKVDTKTLNAFRAAIGGGAEIEDIVKTYAPLLFSDVPHVRRLAVDIEVYSPIEKRIPDANAAQNQVTAIGLSDNEGYDRCLVFKKPGYDMGIKGPDYPKNLDVVFYDNEREMLLEAFRVIDQYPVVLTFVGDAFDFSYLYHRAGKLGIDVKSQCPIFLGKDVALLQRGVHVDLYRFLKNASIRLYALSGAYDQTNLDSISKGLLGKGKLQLSTSIFKLPLYELAHYCWQDANITLEITTFKNELLFRLIVLLMRISRLSMEDVTRQGISSWIQSMFRQEHRSRKAIIPRQIDIESTKASEAQTEAIIKDKRFKGAIVIEPVAGVHFGATVLDFASLYPTIMKRHNISYETIDCPHEECKTATDNRVPETDHWTCKKNKGMIAQTIGFLRDTRVSWFKAKSKDKSLDTKTQDWYSVVEKALKVFVNASYGVTGAQHFELFCMPAAESVTAFGREAILKTKKKAESMGIRVLYGDTDSLFLDRPTIEQQAELVRWSSDTLGIDLEVDKTYKYVALSERKKNYIGVYGSGRVEVKGLSGKKRNTPDFVQDAFRKMLEALSKVDKPEDFENAKNGIREVVNCVISRLEGRAEAYSPDELAFRVQMTKRLDQYGKTVPQHVRAAKMLQESGYDVGPGTIVEYIKTKDGILPVQMAAGKSYWIDKEKYIDTLRSVFEQVLDSVGLDFEELMGFTTLDQFF